MLNRTPGILLSCNFAITHLSAYGDTIDLTFLSFFSFPHDICSKYAFNFISNLPQLELMLDHQFRDGHFEFMG